MGDASGPVECWECRGAIMKIAFCFLTRGDLLQQKVWDLFFAGAPRDRYTIYCHPKEPEQVTGPLLSDRMVKIRVPTQYAHVSLVQATINLFAQAYSDDKKNEYFVLLSESTIPIVPFATFYDGIERCGARSMVSFQVPSSESDHHRRLRAVRQPELFSSAFYYHEQWVVLHRRHLALLLDCPGLALFSRTYAPDEHYFMNVLVHLKGTPLTQFVNRRSTFVNWREREIRTYTNRQTGMVVGRTVHPKTYKVLADADLDEARKDKCWFFRKVDPECDCAAVLPRLTG